MRGIRVGSDVYAWEQGKSGSWWGTFTDPAGFLSWSIVRHKYSHSPTRAGEEYNCKVSTRVGDRVYAPGAGKGAWHASVPSFSREV